MKSFRITVSKYFKAVELGERGEIIFKGNFDLAILEDNHSFSGLGQNKM